MLSQDWRVFDLPVAHGLGMAVFKELRQWINFVEKVVIVLFLHFAAKWKMMDW